MRGRLGGAVHAVGDVECPFVLCLSSLCKWMASQRHDATLPASPSTKQSFRDQRVSSSMLEIHTLRQYA
jgi:hypothetical protein